MNIIKAKQILESAGKKLVREAIEHDDDYYINKYCPMVGKAFDNICKIIKSSLETESSVKMTEPKIEFEDLTTFGHDPIVGCQVKFKFSDEDCKKLWNLPDAEYEAEVDRILDKIRRAVEDEKREKFYFSFDWNTDDIAEIYISTAGIVEYNEMKEREEIRWSNKE